MVQWLKLQKWFLITLCSLAMVILTTCSFATLPQSGFYLGGSGGMSQQSSHISLTYQPYDGSIFTSALPASDNFKDIDLMNMNSGFSGVIGYRGISAPMVIGFELGAHFAAVTDEVKNPIGSYGIMSQAQPASLMATTSGTPTITGVTHTPHATVPLTGNPTITGSGATLTYTLTSAASAGTPPAEHPSVIITPTQTITTGTTASGTLFNNRALFSKLKDDISGQYWLAVQLGYMVSQRFSISGLLGGAYMMENLSFRYQDSLNALAGGGTALTYSTAQPIDINKKIYKFNLSTGWLFEYAVSDRLAVVQKTVFTMGGKNFDDNKQDSLDASAAAIPLVDIQTKHATTVTEAGLGIRMYLF